VGPKSAVLCALARDPKGRACTLLVERSPRLRRHPGEIAFPGGKREAEDRGPWETALREAREECGIEPEAFVYRGDLPPVRTFTSGFTIQPVVGEVPFFALARARPDGGEIARILPVELEVACRGRTEEILGDGVSYPAFLLEGVRVWGASARILEALIRFALPSMGPCRS